MQCHGTQRPIVLALTTYIPASLANSLHSILCQWPQSTASCALRTEDPAPRPDPMLALFSAAAAESALRLLIHASYVVKPLSSAVHRITPLKRTGLLASSTPAGRAGWRCIVLPRADRPGRLFPIAIQAVLRRGMWILSYALFVLDTAESICVDDFHRYAF